MRWLLLLAIGACGSPRPAEPVEPDAEAPIPDGEELSFTPSNQVDATLVAMVSMPIVIATDTTFDTDSGVISGGLTRIAGPNVENGVGFLHKSSDNGARIGVYYVHDLHITGGTIRFTGHRAVGFLVGHSMTLDAGAVIDGSALRDDAGPGGSPFLTGPTPGPTACEGGPGATGQSSDAGGGGGGGSSAGGGGGAADGELGGSGGAACLTPDLQPLRGGGTGGGGGPGAASGALGGGGGGAIQISALDTIRIDGAIVMAGGGGGGGVNGTNAAAGAGGGAGGGILLEALSIAITGVLAANGGGGGGGGASNTAGGDGDPGTATTAAAAGGAAGGAGSTAGGNGGSRASAQTAADAATQDAGGGGGGVGVIFLRALGAPTLTDAVISPEPGTGTVTTN